MSHTREPWELDEDDPVMVYIPHSKFPYWVRVLPEDSEVADQEDYDNARLIAAAPELYDSLKELLEICRVKCGPHDEQILPNKTNHDAMLDACDILDRIRKI